jgi:hypothetical protein
MLSKMGRRCIDCADISNKLPTSSESKTLMQIKSLGVLFIDEAQVLLTTLSNRILVGTGDQKGSAFTALLTHGTGSLYYCQGLVD